MRSRSSWIICAPGGSARCSRYSYRPTQGPLPLAARQDEHVAPAPEDALSASGRPAAARARVAELRVVAQVVAAAAASRSCEDWRRTRRGPRDTGRARACLRRRGSRASRFLRLDVIQAGARGGTAAQRCPLPRCCRGRSPGPSTPSGKRPRDLRGHRLADAAHFRAKPRQREPRASWKCSASATRFRRVAEQVVRVVGPTSQLRPGG